MTRLKTISYRFLAIAIASIFAFGAFGTVQAVVAVAANPPSIVWIEDFNTGVRYSTANQLPLLLHFYGDNCPPCKMLEKKAFQDTQLINKMNSTVVAVKINGEREKEIRDRYQVTRWPTDVYLLPTGEEIYRTVSPQDPAVYYQVLDRIAMRHRDWRAGVVAKAEAQERMLNHRTSTQRIDDAGLEYRAAAASASSTPILNHAAVRAPSPTLPPSTVLVSQPLENAPTLNHFSAKTSLGPNSPAPAVASNSGLPQIVNPSPAGRTISNPHLANGPIEVPAAVPQFPSANPQRYDTSVPTGTLGLPGNGVNVGTISNVPATTIGNRMEVAAPAASSNMPIAVNNYATNNAEPTVPSAAVPSTATPKPEDSKVGLDGYCPVTLYLTVKGIIQSPSCWVEGSPRFAVKHRGRIYLCVSEEMRTEFLKSPDVFAPSLSCFDLIHYIRQQEFVDGKCEFGCFQANTGKIFLFSNQENCDEFRRNEAYYSQLVSSDGQSERVANQPDNTPVR